MNESADRTKAVVYLEKFLSKILFCRRDFWPSLLSTWELQLSTYFILAMPQGRWDKAPDSLSCLLSNLFLFFLRSFFLYAELRQCLWYQMLKDGFPYFHMLYIYFIIGPVILISIESRGVLMTGKIPNSPPSL